MANNKIIFNSNVLLDLTEDTVKPVYLAKGIIAHDKSGNQITGILDVLPIEPLYFDWNIGYVDNGTWKYENPTQTYIDIYEVHAGSRYYFGLGKDVGSRWRVMFTTTDITTVTSGNIAGTRIININSPTAYRSCTFNCTEDGYVLAAKDNIGKSGIKSYAFDTTNQFGPLGMIHLLEDEA